MFLLLYFMIMRKNLIYSLLENKTWHLIMFLCALIALHYKFKNLAISRKNSGIKGMVFKPSFKCLKYIKINGPAILKLETLLYQIIYIYIISSYIIFAERFWFKKKKWSNRKKTCQLDNFTSYDTVLVIFGRLWNRWKSTLSFTPYQTFIFLEILFKIRNQRKILRKKVEKKFLFFVKTPKNNFLDPQTRNPNKTRWKQFWPSGPQQNPTKLIIPYKMVSLLTYFVILLFQCCS